MLVRLATETFVKLCSIEVIWTHSLAACGVVSQAEVGWLARATQGTDSSRLNEESELLEFGNCLCRMAICFMETTVCRATRMWIRIANFLGLIFRGSHSTTKNAKVTPPRKIPAIRYCMYLQPMKIYGPKRLYLYEYICYDKLTNLLSLLQ